MKKGNFVVKWNVEFKTKKLEVSIKRNPDAKMFKN